eukprot:GHVN01014651.1.p1 GENE.GHVN01014651.1~~GHVN01014651.1.p1  ORF type:complete len:263 (+),score=11.84 GHVN01014651.1:99-887(+)
MGVELIYPILPPIPTSQASNPRNSSFYSRKPSKENDSEFTISHYFPAATNRDLVATIDGRRSRLASACEALYTKFSISPPCLASSSKVLEAAHQYLSVCIALDKCADALPHATIKTAPPLKWKSGLITSLPPSNKSIESLTVAMSLNTTLTMAALAASMLVRAADVMRSGPEKLVVESDMQQCATWCAQAAGVYQYAYEKSPESVTACISYSDAPEVQSNALLGLVLCVASIPVSRVELQPVLLRNDVHSTNSLRDYCYQRM